MARPNNEKSPRFMCDTIIRRVQNGSDEVRIYFYYTKKYTAFFYSMVIERNRKRVKGDSAWNNKRSGPYPLFCDAVVDAYIKAYEILAIQ